MRVKGIFVSQRNYLLEIAGGLKENRLNRPSVRKLRVVNYPACLLSSGGHTQEEREPGEDSEYIILNKSRSPLAEIFLPGAALPAAMLGPSWEQLRDCLPQGCGGRFIRQLITFV